MAKILILLLELQTKCVANTCWVLPVHSVGSWQSFTRLFWHLKATAHDASIHVPLALVKEAYSNEPPWTKA